MSHRLAGASTKRGRNWPAEKTPQAGATQQPGPLAQHAAASIGLMPGRPVWPGDAPDLRLRCCAGGRAAQRRPFRAWPIKNGRTRTQGERAAPSSVCGNWSPSAYKRVPWALVLTFKNTRPTVAHTGAGRLPALDRPTHGRGHAPPGPGSRLSRDDPGPP
jgi:hypothetical protein